MRKRDALPFVFTLLGFVGFACSGDSDSKTPFEQACEDFCSKASATPVCGAALSDCSSACVYLEQQFGGACNAQYSALFSCSANSDFMCQANFPVPTSQACTNQALALSQCLLSAPCFSFCDTAKSAGCGGQACVDQCKADTQAYEACGYQELLDCETQSGVTCNGGAPRISKTCQDMAGFTECLSAFDPCAGHCFAAEVAGCVGQSSTACINACKPTLMSSTCMSQYQQLLECHASHGVTCSNGSPTSTADCASQQQAYDACAMP